MGQFIDLTNKKFGRFFVIGPHTSKQRKIFWLCKCDCGVEKWVEGQSLREGRRQSCGCLQRELASKRSLNDISGQQFGRLRVLDSYIRRWGKIFWLCKCDCGTEKWVESQPLRRGLTKSCSCLQRELLSKKTLKDISGQRFGRLLVLNQHKIRGTSGIWLCRCDCGKEKWIRPNALKSGVSKSCGCFGREMRRKGSLEKTKKDKVILTPEQRRHYEAQIKERTLSSEENIRSHPSMHQTDVFLGGAFHPRFNDFQELRITYDFTKGILKGMAVFDPFLT
jgi:hypothetical protein